MHGELDIPTGVHSEGNPQELVRFWVCDNEDFISISIGSLQPPEREPENWGSVIADIAKHAAIAMLELDPALGNIETVMARIELGFHKRLLQNPALTGKWQGPFN